MHNSDDGRQETGGNVSLKDSVPLLTVLEHYNLAGKLRRISDRELRGPCPLHHGDNENAFAVNVDKNRWKCYTHCGGWNSSLDVIMQVEGCDVKKAARILIDIASKNHLIRQQEIRKKAKTPEEPVRIQLPFYKPASDYLKGRGISFETGRKFGFGIVTSGRLKDRLIVPLHWENGDLISYATRDISTKGATYITRRGTPRYAMLFNLHRQKKGGILIVVEGYFDAAKVSQVGFGNVVATMGTEVTDTQLAKLREWSKEVVILFDGDKPGYDGSAAVGARLDHKHRIIALAEGDPAAHSDGVPRTDRELRNLLSRVGLKPGG